MDKTIKKMKNRVGTTNFQVPYRWYKTLQNSLACFCRERKIVKEAQIMCRISGKMESTEERYG